MSSHRIIIFEYLVLFLVKQKQNLNHLIVVYYNVIDNVEFFNCTLDDISVFPYESMLGKIRKIKVYILKQKNDCNK